MSDPKKFIRDSYVKALEKAQEEGTNCGCGDDAIKLDEISCCSSNLTNVKNNELKVPSFGSIKGLAKKANLKKGEIVVDFGSGPGYDLLQAAKMVGKSGKVIGIDMTPEMIVYSKQIVLKMGFENIEIIEGDIEKVPLESAIADVVISNCVINLTSDKPIVFKEAYRILKPGGRLVDADIIAEQELPESLRLNQGAWCSCIAGALTREEYLKAIQDAGFIDINISLEHRLSSKIKWHNQEYLMHSGIITALKPFEH